MPALTRPLLLAAALAAPAAAPAAAEGGLPPAVLGVELLHGWRDGGTHVAGIQIRLAPGWHTYWRTPGAAGMPPQFDWSGSANLATVRYDWPRPQVFESFGETLIGYSGRFVLPVALTPAAADRPLELQLDLAFGVCLDICIPAEARVTARLDGDGPEGAGRAAIERALADLPVGPAAAGVRDTSCALTAGPEGPSLTAEVEFSAPPPPDTTAVIEAVGRPDLWIGAAETRVDGRRLRAVAPLAGAGGIALDRQALRVTLIDASRAVDIRGCPAG